MIKYMGDKKRRAMIREKAMAEGMAKGRVEGKMDDAARMLEKGYAPEEVSSITGLTLDEIKKIPAQKKTS